MSGKKVKMVCKCVSIALVVISVLLMFAPAITIEEKSDRKEIRSYVNSIVEGFNKMDDDELEKVQEEIEEEEINLNLPNFIKKVNKARDVIKDGKISAGELQTISSIMPEFVELQEYYVYLYGDGDDSESEETVETLKSAERNLKILTVLFYISILVSAVVIVLHIINNKLPGVSVVLINLIWMIIWRVNVNKINEFIEDSHDIEECYSVASAPTWAFISVVLSALIWMFMDTIVAKTGNGELEVPSKVSAGNLVYANVSKTSSTAMVCSNCGNVLNPGALFCPACGTKYEVPTEQSQPEEAVTYPEEDQPTSKPDFCPGCGAELDSDALFCGSCGYKIS